MGQRIIYHIDVNSAFLSWTACYQVNVLGKTFDLRTVPSAIAGDKASRHSIILAKSIPAKAFGIQTGEPLFQALKKCPGLIVENPDYALYVEASRHLIALLQEVAPVVEQYSIDEAWVDMSGTEHLYGSPVLMAEKIKNRIRDELGFTVNIGVSNNKLLAKMAGGFKPHDAVHTLFPAEIEAKLWPLPARELFYVGPATESKLKMLGIETIGDIARASPAMLRSYLHKHGEVIWNYANGRMAGDVSCDIALNKGYGNSTTTPFDVTDTVTAHRVLLSLCETVGMRMRKDQQTGSCISVSLRSNEFVDFSHQAQMKAMTNATMEIYNAACQVFDKAWDKKTALRQLGVSVGKATRDGFRQHSFFDGQGYDRLTRLDTAVDAIREKYGEGALFRACFIGDKFTHMGGGHSPGTRTGLTKPLQ